MRLLTVATLALAVAVPALPSFADHNGSVTSRSRQSAGAVDRGQSTTRLGSGGFKYQWRNDGTQNGTWDRVPSNTPTPKRQTRPRARPAVVP